MTGRLFDERVGYFSQSMYDYSRDEHRAQERTYVTRYRLEKKDPNAAMAEYWRIWNFEYSIYGHDINIQPKVAGGYNLLPIIDWLRKKARGEKVDLWGRTKD